MVWIEMVYIISLKCYIIHTLIRFQKIIILLYLLPNRCDPATQTVVVILFIFTSYIFLRGRPALSREHWGHFGYEHHPDLSFVFHCRCWVLLFWKYFPGLYFLLPESLRKCHLPWDRLDNPEASFLLFYLPDYVPD